MRPLLRMEFSKAFHSRLTWATFAVATAFALVSAVNSIISFQTVHAKILMFWESSYKSPFAVSLFTSWLPSATMQPVPNLFFFLAPLLVALGFSWSLGAERGIGHAQQVCVRVAPSSFYAAKWVATFVVGGLVVAVPLAVNLVACALFIPAYQPEANDAIYMGMSETVIMSSLFYRAPWLYVAARTALDFALSGLWAVCALGLSVLSRRPFVFVVGAYVALILFKNVGERLCWLVRGDGWSLTVLDWLRAHGDLYDNAWPVIALGALAMLAASLVPFVALRERDAL